MFLNALHAPTLLLQTPNHHIDNFIFSLETPKLLRVSYAKPVSLFVHSPSMSPYGAFLFIQEVNNMFPIDRDTLETYIAIGMFHGLCLAVSLFIAWLLFWIIGGCE
mgnify:CR=1 FL=1